MISTTGSGLRSLMFPWSEIITNITIGGVIKSRRWSNPCSSQYRIASECVRRNDLIPPAVIPVGAAAGAHRTAPKAEVTVQSILTRLKLRIIIESILRIVLKCTEESWFGETA